MRPVMWYYNQAPGPATTTARSPWIRVQDAVDIRDEAVSQDRPFGLSKRYARGFLADVLGVTGTLTWDFSQDGGTTTHYTVSQAVAAVASFPWSIPLHYGRHFRFSFVSAVNLTTDTFLSFSFEEDA